MKAMFQTFVVALLLGLGGCQQSEVRGPQGQTLKLAAPASASVQRGRSDVLSFRVDRQGFTSPVTVSLSQLPQGVHADDATKRVSTNEASFMLNASADAAIVRNHKMKITAEGPGGATTTQFVALTVRE